MTGVFVYVYANTFQKTVRVVYLPQLFKADKSSFKVTTNDQDQTSFRFDMERQVWTQQATITGETDREAGTAFNKGNQSSRRRPSRPCSS